MPVFMSEEIAVFQVLKQEPADPSKLNEFMNTIKEYKAVRTQDGFVAKQFQDAVISFVQIYTLPKKEAPTETCESTTIHLDSNENEIVKIFCNVCADILKGGESFEYPGINKEYIELLLKMLLHLINISYNNDDLRGVIAQEKGFLITVTKKLHEWKDQYLNAGTVLQLEDKGTILEMLFVILHNISMCGSRNVLEVNYIVAMKPYLKSKDDKIGLLCFATIAVLAKEREFKIFKSNANVITHLMLAIKKALEVKTYNGWSLEELARTVWHLARNDNNKRLFVEHNAVPLLVKIIDRGNNAEQIGAISAILELSFDNNNRTDMRTKWNVIEILQRSSKSSDQLVQKNSRKALWTIQNLECNYGMKKSEITSSDRRVVLISYNSCNKDVVGLIHYRLRHLDNHYIKMLEDTSESNTVESIAESVEKANIVLVCYSSKYKNSLSSRIAAEYALQLGKTIILVNIEEDYKADGWLDCITTFVTSFDLSTPHLLDKNVNVLIQSIKAYIYGIHKATEVPKQNVLSDQEVQTTQKPHWHKCVKFSEISILQIGLGLMSVSLLLYCLLVTMWCCFNSSTSCCYNSSISCCYNSSIKVCSSEELEPPSTTPIPGRPDEKEKTKKDQLTSQIFHSVMNWTLSQVENWLKDKIIQKDMFLSQEKQLQKLRGKDVAFLKLLVRECPTIFYQTIREQLGMKDIQSMSDFRFALEDIETVQDPSSKHNTSTKALETEERSNV